MGADIGAKSGELPPSGLAAPMPAMGRWGPKCIDCDASGEFFEDYAARFARGKRHDATWAYFHREWSRLPPQTQDDYGVEYLLAVIELWLWARTRAEVLRSQQAHLLEAIGEHGPRLNAQHPGLIHAQCVYALAQFEQQSPSAQTRARALELIDWNVDAITRLGLYGGPQSADGKAARRSLSKLKRALAS